MLSSSDTDDLVTFLTDTKRDIRNLKSFELIDNEILLAIVQPNFKKNIPLVLNTIIEPVINFLSAANFSSGCGKCGKCSPVYCTEIKKQHHHYCEICAAHSKKENSQKSKQQKILF